MKLKVSERTVHLGAHSLIARGGGSARGLRTAALRWGAGCLLAGLLATGQAATLISGGIVLSLADGEDETFEGYVLIVDGLIEAIGPGAYAGELPESTETVDASGKIVMPGFVSGHNHLWQSAFRGIAADGVLYPWLEALHRTYGDDFTDGDFYAFTLHGALDQLAHGITTTYNHSQRLDASEAQYLESLDASFDAGQHFIFAYNSDLSGTPADIRHDVGAFVERARGAGSPLLLGLSLSAVGNHGDDLEKFRLEMELARSYGMTVQLHYLEQFSRRFADRRKWPMFREADALGDDVSYAHFIHPTDRILEEAAEAGSAMIWNPLSNGRLASGLADIPRYLEAGLGVGMGVDGAASADIADPFDNMRMGMYALRMKHHKADVMTPIEVLRLHTLRTAEVLKVDDRVGSLEAGKAADVLVVDPGEPVTGALFDPAATLVLAASSENIERIYVAGALQVVDGAPVHHDMAALQQEVVERVEAVRTRAAGKTPAPETDD